MEGAKHSAAFCQLPQDMYPISQSVGRFAELEYLFCGPELFYPTTNNKIIKREPVDTREDAFPEKILNRFRGSTFVRRFSSNEFVECGSKREQVRLDCIIMCMISRYEMTRIFGPKALLPSSPISILRLYPDALKSLSRAFNAASSNHCSSRKFECPTPMV